ncbi:histidine kinase [Maribacter sp.]|nr:histidine kinase [Maribacter sp.]
MNDRLPILDKILQNRPLTHLLFWCVILILQSQIFLYAGHDFKVVLVSTLALLPSIILAAYLLAYYQLPKLAYKKKYVRFVFSLLASIYLFTFLGRICTVYLAEPYLGIEEAPSLNYMWMVAGSIDRLARNYLLAVYLAPILMASIKLIKQRSQVKSQMDALEKEKATAELKFLKTQIHPHFLLNTLNNIYALTLKKSDLAPDSVLKLSEMLTYVLYRCSEKYVPVVNEIKLLENYISLEKLRYGKNLKLSFTREIANEDSMIAPLILLSVIENAFKHGASGATEVPEIKIKLIEAAGQLDFRVFNSKEKENNEEEIRKGIGGQNSIKQLDLLYPNSYTYQVVEDATSYEVILKINLNTSSNEN